MRQSRSSRAYPAFALALLRDIWLIWLALALLTTLPYVAAALRTPAGHVFTGVLTAYDDTFAYFAWIRQGGQCRFLMCDPYTSEAQSCEFFLPLWSLLGLCARSSGVPIALTYHAARLLAGLLLLAVARSVAGSVMKSKTRVRYTLWLYATSGGFGWLVFVFGNRGALFGATAAAGSVDLNLPEAIAFRSVFSQVHFVVGAALVCGGIKLLFSGIVEKRARRAFLAGVLVSVVSVVHPYMVAVVCGVAGAALLASPWLSGSTAPQRNYYSSALTTAAFALGAIPGISYLIYLKRSNEVLREWLRITDTFSPAPWEYALGFGIVTALAVWGFRLMCDRRAPYGRLLLIWAVVQASLLYAPVSFQRRFVEGLQLPLSIAASVALFQISRSFFTGHASSPRRKVILAGVLAFASITNIGFIIGQTIARGAASGATDPRRYLPGDLASALDWLRTNSKQNGVVFSSYLTGNVVPSETGLRVFLGHYAQTLRNDEKGAQVIAFYTNTMSDEAARRLFSQHRVGYIIYGPFEHDIASTFVPPNWLRLVHRTGEVEIFEVIEQPE